MYSHYCFILVFPAHIYYCHVIAHHCIEQMNMMMAVVYMSTCRRT